jgi:tetratricopeptide (TPR) repeat protein
MGEMPLPTPAAPRSPWIARPWVDLVIGCGGWSVPLLALAYFMPRSADRQWAAMFYTLALVANYPHYMATVYRAYGRADVGRHQLYTVWATLGLIALGALAHLQVWLIPWLFTAYIFWSPWHYTGQNYGLLLMFARRGGLEVSDATRRSLRLAFVASYIMLLAAFNEGATEDPLVLSLGLPSSITRGIGAIGLAVFLVAGVWAMLTVTRRSPWRSLVAPVTLYVTQGLWFVAPTAISWVTAVAIPQTRYSAGVLALMHSAQYLWITQYFAKREQGAAWRAGRYWLAVIAGGAALFLPIPWLASYAAHMDFTASMLVVTAIVNIHHFMIDGVVWKLRDTRVAKTLTPTSLAAPASSRQAGPAPLAASSQPASTKLAQQAKSGLAAAAVLALAALAAIDQWRYRLVLNADDASSLQAAVALNPFDESAQARLLTALIESGRSEDARAHLERAMARRPDDLDAFVNAGVLARREGRTADAERYWRAAVAKAPSASHVHLYLAELLDEANRSADALPHYRAYLERVVEQRQTVRPDPRVVIPVILKFGDALARTGDPVSARAQYALAAHMAAQTGQPDLGAEARRGLAGGR